MDPTAIVCLRPLTDLAIELLDMPANWPFEFTASPPEFHITHQPKSPRVLRLGFNTETTHEPRGYYFGSSSNCQVKIPPYYDIDSEGCYFRIQYNFNSGALLIVAVSEIKVGLTNLEENGTLLLMAGSVIKCGANAFQFVVEFPDLEECADAHEHNYQKYVKDFNLQNAPYLATSHKEELSLGPRYKSKAILGAGAYGMVHKAVDIKTGELYAIKVLWVLNDKDLQTAFDELEVLVDLSPHVSLLATFLYWPLTLASRISLNIGILLSLMARCTSSQNWLPTNFVSI